MVRNVNHYAFPHRAVGGDSAFRTVPDGGTGAGATLQGGDDILISSSTYQDVGAVTGLTPGQQIPTLSTTGLAVSGDAGVNGNPLGVFFNGPPDSNCAVASPLTVTQYTPSGAPNFVLNLPAASATNAADGIVTSFSSKSEGSLTISPNGQSVTLMGYSAPGRRGRRFQRANPRRGWRRAIRISRRPPIVWRRRSTRRPRVTYTQTNSFSGNNPRAGVLLAGNTLLMVGNAGNGNGGNDITNGTGVQYTTLGTRVNSAGGVPAISNGTPVVYGPG